MEKLVDISTLVFLILKKVKEDMEMRRFSHWTKGSYELKAKDEMRYFKKTME